MRVEFFYAPFNGKKKIHLILAMRTVTRDALMHFRPNPLSAPGPRKKIVN